MRQRALVMLLAVTMLAAAGCVQSAAVGTDPGTSPVAIDLTARRVLPVGATAPLFNDLGEHHMRITTQSPLAQRYFDQGLILTYGFNHAEAERSFREAARLDPACAMCWWGAAYALGPNINKPMDPADAPAALKAVRRAVDAAERVSSRERALVHALTKRYELPAPADRAPLDREYARAMQAVAARHPNDRDVQTLWAEAIMDTMPWDYYQANGAPKEATIVLLATLERVLERQPNHPGATHLYIHAVEPSSTPARAEAAADQLRGLVPGAGHLVHMPSHIYLRVGRYEDASIVNQEAAAADESYISQCRAQGFYPAAYYPHNIHFLWASSSFEGRSDVALGAARKLVGAITPEMVQQQPFVEEFLPVHLVGLARFGRWEAILTQPTPPSEHRYLTGMWHYARGVALAATGKTSAARKELAALQPIRDEWAKKTDFVFLSGSAPTQLLGIAAHVLRARIAGAEGHWRRALPTLRAAVEIQDDLPYTEPPPWYFPVREALGHALLQAGQPAEAEAVYRDQLRHTPANGWSLRGLAASLRAQKKDAAAVETELATAWQHADVTPPSSIF